MYFTDKKCQILNHTISEKNSKPLISVDYLVFDTAILANDYLYFYSLGVLLRHGVSLSTADSRQLQVSRLDKMRNETVRSILHQERTLVYSTAKIGVVLACFKDGK